METLYLKLKGHHNRARREDQKGQRTEMSAARSSYTCDREAAPMKSPMWLPMQDLSHDHQLTGQDGGEKSHRVYCYIMSYRQWLRKGQLVFPRDDPHTWLSSVRQTWRSSGSAGSRKRETLGLRWASETSKPTFSDTLPPTRPHTSPNPSQIVPLPDD